MLFYANRSRARSAPVSTQQHGGFSAVIRRGQLLLAAVCAAIAAIAALSAATGHAAGLRPAAPSAHHPTRTPSPHRPRRASPPPNNPARLPTPACPPWLAR